MWHSIGKLTHRLISLDEAQGQKRQVLTRHGSFKDNVLRMSSRSHVFQLFALEEEELLQLQHWE